MSYGGRLPGVSGLKKKDRNASTHCAGIYHGVGRMAEVSETLIICR